MESIKKNEWNPIHENILKEWKAKSFAYLWLQNNSCYYYITIYNWLAYIVIIFSSFSAATMFALTNSSSNDLCKETSFGISIIYVQYIIGSLTLLSAILTSLIRQIKPGEMYQIHSSTTKKYNSLIRSIDKCLSLISDLRPEPNSFIDKTGNELENLAENQIEPPLFIIKKFEKIFGPIDRILYGEDMVEIWKLQYRTNKIKNKIMKYEKNNKNSLQEFDITSTRTNSNENININDCSLRKQDTTNSMSITPENVVIKFDKFGRVNSMK